MRFRLQVNRYRKSEAMITFVHIFGKRKIYTIDNLFLEYAKIFEMQKAE